MQFHIPLSYSCGKACSCGSRSTWHSMLAFSIAAGIGGIFSGLYTGNHSRIQWPFLLPLLNNICLLSVECCIHSTAHFQPDPSENESDAINSCMSKHTPTHPSSPKQMILHCWLIVPNSKYTWFKQLPLKLSVDEGLFKFYGQVSWGTGTSSPLLRVTSSPLG